jgi:hypothetical protein
MKVGADAMKNVYVVLIECILVFQVVDPLTNNGTKTANGKNELDP